MNIHDLWPEVNAPKESADAWYDLLNLRQETFTAFVAIEESAGVMAYPSSLSSKAGQDRARLLMAKCLEEYVEAMNADSRDHKLEELIDSLNYLWSILLLDDSIARYVFANEDTISMWRNASYRYSLFELQLVTYTLLGVTDTFRNRAWMHNAQDIHFSGREQLIKAVGLCTQRLLQHFQSWSEFWTYFVAKDNVLQFRLRSKY